MSGAGVAVILKKREERERRGGGRDYLTKFVALSTIFFRMAPTSLLMSLKEGCMSMSGALRLAVILKSVEGLGPCFPNGTRPMIFWK
jgi:hypothetical protein